MGKNEFRGCKQYSEVLKSLGFGVNYLDAESWFRNAFFIWPWV